MQNTAGIHVARQSAFDKAKAEAKAKRLRDEKEAASVLEDFVKEFNADVSDDEHAEWTVGGVEGGLRHSSSQSVGARVSMGGARRHFTAPRQDDEFGPRAGKKRNLDSFLEEIKRDHAVRDSREKLARIDAGETSLSIDSSDQNTAASTLHIACLPLSTQQSQLRELLTPYGHIVNMRIGAEKSSRGFTRRSAFATVVFEKPQQAEKAQTAIDGRYMGEGWRIKASWGDHGQQKGTHFMVLNNVVAKDIPSAPFDARIPDESLSKAQLSRAPPPSALTTSPNVPKWGQPQQRSVKVQRSHDARQIRRIHKVIEAVIEFGPEFEALLMESEKYNEDYAFLFDSNLPDAQYYRWKMYALQSGDSPYDWRTEPFQMFGDGELWIPPDLVKDNDEDVLSDPDEEEARLANQARGYLGQSGQQKFLWLLRGVDSRRGSIARGMAYAMRRADAAEEIVDIIIASLCSKHTPLPKKIARLYLVSDILHNSSGGHSNVWKYRHLFETRLASVFAHLHTIYTSFDGRIKADNFRRQVIAVTSVWETWMVFNNNNVEAWVETFLGRQKVEEQSKEETVELVVEDPVERKSRWKSVAETSGQESMEAGGFTTTPSKIEEEDIDGEDMEESDVDGVPMDEEDLDGVSMEDEDVDGEPMEEEDVDGMPMEESRAVTPVAQPEPVQQSPERKIESTRLPKRQRMRAVDMFMDD